MRVLVSNDDGVDAPGILMLARQLASIGDVVVVAPDRDRSGASNSLTLDQPIRCQAPGRRPIQRGWHSHRLRVPRLVRNAQAHAGYRGFGNQQRRQSGR